MEVNDGGDACSEAPFRSVKSLGDLCWLLLGLEDLGLLPGLVVASPLGVVSLGDLPGLDGTALGELIILEGPGLAVSVESIRLGGWRTLVGSRVGMGTFDDRRTLGNSRVL